MHKYKIALVYPIQMLRPNAVDSASLSEDGYSIHEGYSSITVAEFDHDPGLQAEDEVFIDNLSAGNEVFRIKCRVTKRENWVEIKRDSDGEDLFSIRIIVEAEDREVLLKIAELIKQLNPGMF